jgi:hypothetical protein
MVSILMEVNENERQLLAFMELSGAELLNTSGNRFGRSSIDVYCKDLNKRS